LSLQQRVALVTGASRGIGKDIAMGLGRAGARVVVAYRANKAAADKVVAGIRRHGTEALAVATDVTEPSRVKEMMDTVLGRFGRLDILVNNVGIFHWKTVLETSFEEWLAILQSNLLSVFHTSKFALPAMRRQRWGRIINLGAVGAERAFGQAKISAYSSAKAGMVAFSRSLALEEARHGITVNVVNPPVIDDKELTRDEAQRISDARFPVGRPATGEDIAEAVVFFASEEAAFVTGQVLNVSGGWML
jgi:3-oxoacyl-[acyl-carrier protein] reductase